MHTAPYNLSTEGAVLLLFVKWNLQKNYTLFMKKCVFLRFTADAELPNGRLAGVAQGYEFAQAALCLCPYL